MLTAFEICKAAYPGIPEQIFLEYADLLPAEASALSAEFAASDAKFFPIYKNLRTSYSMAFQYVSGGPMPSKLFIQQNFLNPQNSAELQSYNSSFHFTEIHWVFYNPNTRSYSYEGNPFDNYANLDSRYDRRLFENVQAVKVKQTTAPATFYGNSYKGSQFYARIIIQVLLTANKKQYIGAETIYALYENGVTIAGVDYARLSAFVTYINAYKKFSTQIDAEKSLLTNQAAASLAAYQQDFKDRADREKTELQSKRLQIFIAIDNEAKSAQRDFQNMLINAQNLRNTLGGSLG